MRRPKVVPLDRTRRKRHWSLGDPPKPPRRKCLWGRWLFWSVYLSYLEFGTLGDVAMGLAKGTTDCKVVAVVDGDTITAWCGGTDFQRVRLTGFDTPEIFSPKCNSERWRGLRATVALKGRLWAAGNIALYPSGRDRYDRLLARMTVDGVSVGNDLIARGLARPYVGGIRRGWC